MALSIVRVITAGCLVLSAVIATCRSSCYSLLLLSSLTRVSARQQLGGPQRPPRCPPRRKEHRPEMRTHRIKFKKADAKRANDYELTYTRRRDEHDHTPTALTTSATCPDEPD